MSSDLWRLPLVHVALAGATLTLLFYMPLRLGSSSTDGMLHFLMSEYDSGIAILLFAAGAYASWFTGRHMFVERRALFYTMAALALFWIGFLAVDGLRFFGATQLLLLATSALIVALAARSSKPDVWALALQRSSLLVSIALAAIASALLSNSARLTFTDGAILVLLAATYAVSSGPRFCERVAAAILAHASAVMASIAFLVALSSLDLRSETLFYAAWALLPFALYAIRRATARFRVEMQLGIPFMRVADFEIVLLVLLISVIAVASSPASQGKILAVENLRGAMLLVLPAAAIYGALRCWYERSFFGAAIIPVALFLEALIALRVDAQWFATAAVLTLFPGFVVASRYAYARRTDWVDPSGRAANAVLILASIASIAQASVHLRVGDELLLAPCLAFAAIALSSFAAALSAKNQARIHYFRVGLFALVLAFALACLRAGFDPLGDIEIYTTPIAVILLVVAYLTLRGTPAEYRSDTSVLLWVGSLLFAAPLLLHALQYRLFLGVPAPWRDLTVLCASLALLVFGVVGRMRAPVLVGMASLAVELSALGLTSVDWLQIPLKVYLISTGALILLIWGLLEFRREQILLMRSRLKERRETARERFGEWR